MIPARRWHRLTLAAVALSATVGCDQATKQLAIAELKGQPSSTFLGGFVQLGYAENPGAFLSLFGDLPRPAQFWLLTAGVGVLLLALLGYLVGSRRLDRVESVGYALLAGGGLSNWVDRLLNEGRVVDFMVVGMGPLRTGVFNVADVAIMAGIAVLLLRGLKGRPEAPAPPSRSGG